MPTIIPGKMTVALGATGNLDYPAGSPRRELFIEVQRVSVPTASLEGASKMCRQFIETYGLGGGNWIGGQVQVDGHDVARISYNGRCWKPGPDGDEILLDD